MVVVVVSGVVVDVGVVVVAAVAGGPGTKWGTTIGMGGSVVAGSVVEGRREVVVAATMLVVGRSVVAG